MRVKFYFQRDAKATPRKFWPKSFSIVLFSLLFVSERMPIFIFIMSKSQLHPSIHFLPLCLESSRSSLSRDAHTSSSSSGIIPRRSQSLQFILGLSQGLCSSCLSEVVVWTRGPGTDARATSLRQHLATLGGNSCRCLYPWSCWFGPDPDLMTKGERRNVDRLSSFS